MDIVYRHFIVEGGPLLDVATAYRDERTRVMQATAEYVNSIGAKGYRMGWHRLAAVQFSGAAPHGFCKPDKHGCVVPKKGSKWASEFAELPSLPECGGKIAAVIRFVGQVSHETGCRSVGCFEPVGLYWYAGDGPIMLRVADVRVVLAGLRRENPDIKITNPEVEAPLVLDGLREILKEEWDLMAAKHRISKGERVAA